MSKAGVNTPSRTFNLLYLEYQTLNSIQDKAIKKTRFIKLQVREGLREHPPHVYYVL